MSNTAIPMPVGLAKEANGDNRASIATIAISELITAAYTCQHLADDLSVNSAHISKLLKGNRVLTPTLDKALVKAGYLKAKPKRIAIHIDSTRDTQKRFNDLARKSGLSRSDYFEYVIRIMEREG